MLFSWQILENFAFSDATHVDDAIPARDFPSFAAAATERLGEDLARALKKGDVLALSGEIGAGKCPRGPYTALQPRLSATAGAGPRLAFIQRRGYGAPPNCRAAGV